MQLATLSTPNPLNPRVPPFFPRVTHPRTIHPAPTQLAINKKRLRAQRLFPLCLRFMPLSNSLRAAFCIQRKSVAKRIRQLKLLRKYHSSITWMFNDQAEKAQALFHNIASFIQSITVLCQRGGQVREV
jgi:hypothetical protein